MPSVVVNGVRLAYDVAGSGEPVVLVAGTGMPGSAWELLCTADLCRAGFEVFTFDQRGVRASDGPDGPYSVTMLADDLAGLVEHLRLGPVRLVGLSLGGSVAQLLAATRPELVRSVVLWACVGRSPAFFRALLDVEKEMGSDAVPASWHVWQTLLISLPFDRLQNDDALVESVTELLRDGVVWSGDGRAGQFAADVAWDLADHSDVYEAIECPCLVIAHEHDIIYPPRAARRAVSLIRDASLQEIPGCAHGQAIEASSIVAPAICDFFAAH